MRQRWLALVTRVVLDGKRAVGVEFLYEGAVHRITARYETVLPLGAFNTPKVLMHSGIGDERDQRDQRAKLQEIKEALQRRMHRPIPETGKWLAQIVAGYFAYHAVPTNSATIGAFRYRVTVLWHRLLCRARCVPPRRSAVR